MCRTVPEHTASCWMQRQASDIGKGHLMKEPLSLEAAVAEVEIYTGLKLTTDEIRSLHKILSVPRKDTAILVHLRRAHHPLGDLPHLSEGKNWWDKVHKAMSEADYDPYEEEEPGTHKSPVAHDRKAVIFWLDHRILPALNGADSANTISNWQQGTGAQDQLKGAGEPTSGKPDTGSQGRIADAKKRLALENHAMEAAIRYYEEQWHVEPVSHIKKVLDLRLVHRVSGEVRRVEVKGSSQAATKVEVTEAEVKMSHKENSELFVLDEIDYQDTGLGLYDYKCRGGRRRVGKWHPDIKDLTPKTYDYHLGTDFGTVDTSLAGTRLSGTWHSAIARVRDTVYGSVGWGWSPSERTCYCDRSRAFCASNSSADNILASRNSASLRSSSAIEIGRRIAAAMAAVSSWSCL